MNVSFVRYATVLGVDTGLAIMSRWPISHQSTAGLPSTTDQQEWNRSIASAVIDGPRGRIPVFTTHLSYPPHESAIRQRQVAAATAFIAEQDHVEFPPVLTGDFNADPLSDEIRMLTGRAVFPSPRSMVLLDTWEFAGVGQGATWCNSNSWAAHSLERSRRIDYIFVGQPREQGMGHTVTARLEGLKPHKGVFGSDHYAVFAELRY